MFQRFRAEKPFRPGNSACRSRARVCDARFRSEAGRCRPGPARTDLPRQPRPAGWSRLACQPHPRDRRGNAGRSSPAKQLLRPASDKGACSLLAPRRGHHDRAGGSGARRHPALATAELAHVHEPEVPIGHLKAESAASRHGFEITVCDLQREEGRRWLRTAWCQSSALSV